MVSTTQWTAACVALLSVAACSTEAAAPRQGVAPNAADTSAPGEASSNGPPAEGAPVPPSDATPAPRKPNDCLGAGAATGNFDWTIASGGRQRSARVHVPPGYDGKKPTPVLVNFHGRMSTASQQELISATTAKSNEAGFIVVYPTGVGQTWNGGLCCGQAQTENVDDVAFTRALIDEFETKLCVDKKRVFATGLSNGGFMVNRLACELADRIAAIGPVAGQLLSPTCTPSRPVPVIHFHGTKDTIVSYSGQFGTPGIESSVAAWAARNGCAPSPKQTFASGDATCKTFGGCNANADVTLCTIAEGGHNWPGGLPLAGKTSQDLHATDAMWDFFAKHPMP